MNLPILHGEHACAFEPARLVFAGGSVAALGVCAWLGLAASAAHARALALVTCGAVFVLRTLVMFLWLNSRRLGWLEGAADVLLVWVVLYGLLVFWATDSAPPGPLDALAAALFLSGSALTSGSEVARWKWKQRPESRGHLYTGGAFRHARHINYFGEVVSFSGFALLTRRWGSAVVPLAMLLAFLFIHVPALECHLSARYGRGFPCTGAAPGR